MPSGTRGRSKPALALRGREPDRARLPRVYRLFSGHVHAAPVHPGKEAMDRITQALARERQNEIARRTADRRTGRA
jgi:hypothetical protein